MQCTGALGMVFVELVTYKRLRSLVVDETVYSEHLNAVFEEPPFFDHIDILCSKVLVEL